MDTWSMSSSLCLPCLSQEDEDFYTHSTVTKVVYEIWYVLDMYRWKITEM